MSVLLLITACETTESPIISNENQIESKIQTLFEDEYDTYLESYPNYPGGFALQIRYRGEDYFVQKGFNEEITKRYHFRPESNTKTFTAAAIILLHQRGELNVNHLLTDYTPAGDKTYLPDTENFNIPNKNQIRIWDLLLHRAGVFDLANQDIPDTIQGNVPYTGDTYIEYIRRVDPNHTMTFEELVGIVAKHQLYNFLPGEKWSYSNTGYTILGYIIERISGKSYKQFLTDEFVIPLALTDTSLPDEGNDQTIPYPFVNGYYYMGDVTIDATERNMSGNVAEGNIISSTNDLCTFFRSLLRGESAVNILMVATYMMDCKPIGDVGSRTYGAGLFRYVDLGYGHGGDGDGFSSKIFYDTDNDLAMVLFHNCWNASGGAESFYAQDRYITEICYKVHQAVLNQE